MHGFSLDPDLDESPAKPIQSCKRTENRPQPSSKRRKLEAGFPASAPGTRQQPLRSSNGSQKLPPATTPTGHLQEPSSRPPSDQPKISNSVTFRSSAPVNSTSSTPQLILQPSSAAAGAAAECEQHQMLQPNSHRKQLQTSPDAEPVCKPTKAATPDAPQGAVAADTQQLQPLAVASPNGVSSTAASTQPASVADNLPLLPDVSSAAAPSHPVQQQQVQPLTSTQERIEQLHLPLSFAASQVADHCSRYAGPTAAAAAPGAGHGILPAAVAAGSTEAATDTAKASRAMKQAKLSFAGKLQPLPQQSQQQEEEAPAAAPDEKAAGDPMLAGSGDVAAANTATTGPKSAGQKGRRSSQLPAGQRNLFGQLVPQKAKRQQKRQAAATGEQNTAAELLTSPEAPAAEEGGCDLPQPAAAGGDADVTNPVVAVLSSPDEFHVANNKRRRSKKQLAAPVAGVAAAAGDAADVGVAETPVVKTASGRGRSSGRASRTVRGRGQGRSTAAAAVNAELPASAEAANTAADAGAGIVAADQRVECVTLSSGTEKAVLHAADDTAANMTAPATEQAKEVIEVLDLDPAKQAAAAAQFKQLFAGAKAAAAAAAAVVKPSGKGKQARGSKKQSLTDVGDEDALAVERPAAAVAVEAQPAAKRRKTAAPAARKSAKHLDTDHDGSSSGKDSSNSSSDPMSGTTSDPDDLSDSQVVVQEELQGSRSRRGRGRGRGAGSSSRGRGRGANTKQRQQQQQQPQQEVLDLCSSPDKPITAAARGDRPRRTRCAAAAAAAVEEQDVVVVCDDVATLAVCTEQKAPPTVATINAGKVPDIFMSKAERKAKKVLEAQQEKERQEQERQQQMQQKEQQRLEREQQQQQQGRSDGPVHPFFAKPSKQQKLQDGDTAAAGAAGVAAAVVGSAAWRQLGGKTFGLPIAPVHITQQQQQQQQQDGDEEMVTKQAAVAMAGVRLGDLSLQCSDVVHCGVHWRSCQKQLECAQQIGFTYSVRPAAAAQDSRNWTIATAATSSQKQQQEPPPPQETLKAGDSTHPLILQLARLLHWQAAGAAAAAAGVTPGNDACLLDLPAEADYVNQLQHELQQLQQVAANNSRRDVALCDVTATTIVANDNNDVVVTDSAPDKNSSSSISSSLLWTVKYAPAAAAHMCGNAAGIAAFKQFLEDWKGIIQQQQAAAAGGKDGKAGGGGGGVTSHDSDESSWFQSVTTTTRSDVMSSWLDDAAAAGNGRCTCLAVLGPPGCGKTSSVYALAEELGFRVLEVNPTVERTAGQVLRMVGEATRSRRIQHATLQQQQQQGTKQAAALTPAGAVDKQQRGQRQPAAAATAAGGKGKVAAAAGSGRGRGRARGGRGRGRQQRDEEVQQHAGNSSHSEASDVVVGRGNRSRRKQQQQNAVAAAAAKIDDDPWQHPAAGMEIPNTDNITAEPLTLLLFDEADTLLDHDRGFIASLPALIRSSRRPIVLCLNSPRVPAALSAVQVQQVTLLKPQAGELLKLLVLVMAAEGRQGMSLQQLQEIIQQQGQDIRACLTALQFWSTQQQQQGAIGSQQQQQQGSPGCALQVAPWCYLERQQQIAAWTAAAEQLMLKASLDHADEQQRQQQQGADANGVPAAVFARQQQLVELFDQQQQRILQYLQDFWQQRQQQLAAVKKQRKSLLAAVASDWDSGWDTTPLSSYPGTPADITDDDIMGQYNMLQAAGMTTITAGDDVTAAADPAPGSSTKQGRSTRRCTGAAAGSSRSRLRARSAAEPVGKAAAAAIAAAAAARARREAAAAAAHAAAAGERLVSLQLCVLESGHVAAQVTLLQAQQQQQQHVNKDRPAAAAAAAAIGPLQSVSSEGQPLLSPPPAAAATVDVMDVDGGLNIPADLCATPTTPQTAAAAATEAVLVAEAETPAPVADSHKHNTQQQDVAAPVAAATATAEVVTPMTLSPAAAVTPPPASAAAVAAAAVMPLPTGAQEAQQLRDMMLKHLPSQPAKHQQLQQDQQDGGCKQQEKQTAAALYELAAAAAVLSDVDILTAACDSSIPVSGSCPRLHKTLALLQRPPNPACNTLVLGNSSDWCLQQEQQQQGWFSRPIGVAEWAQGLAVRAEENSVALGAVLSEIDEGLEAGQHGAEPLAGSYTADVTVAAAAGEALLLHQLLRASKSAAALTDENSASASSSTGVNISAAAGSSSSDQTYELTRLTSLAKVLLLSGPASYCLGSTRSAAAAADRLAALSRICRFESSRQLQLVSGAAQGGGGGGRGGRRGHVFEHYCARKLPGLAAQGELLHVLSGMYTAVQL